MHKVVPLVEDHVQLSPEGFRYVDQLPGGGQQLTQCLPIEFLEDLVKFPLGHYVDSRNLKDRRQVHKALFYEIRSVHSESKESPH